MGRYGTGVIKGLDYGACVLPLTGFSTLPDWGIIPIKREYQLETEGLRKIVVKSNNSILNIYTGDLITGLHVMVEGRKWDVNNTSVQNANDTLAIIGSKHQSHSVRITIIVPKSSNHYYEASVLSGSVTLNSLQGKDFIVLSNNGNVAFSDIQAETIEITANNGAINIDNARGGTHRIMSDCGAVLVTNSSGETLLIENDNGTIRGKNLIYKTITPISNNGTVDIQKL